MDSEQALFDILWRRRSTRAYDADRAVSRETIERMLQAAMAAPSACNLQTWEFIVATEPDAVSRLKACLGEGNGRHYNAPCGLIVCSRSEWIPWGGDGSIDCAAAIENLMLAATAMGLGTVWIGDFDGDAIRAAFGVPDAVSIVSVVVFGYPAEEKRPRTQYDAEAVYWQAYDRARVREAHTVDLALLP